VKPAHTQRRASHRVATVVRAAGHRDVSGRQIRRLIASAKTPQSTQLEKIHRISCASITVFAQRAAWQGCREGSGYAEFASGER
jgi:hypothetical protein